MILHVIESVADQVFIPLTVGGGVRQVDDVRRLLNAGADKISINTAAVQNPRLVADASAASAAQCIVVAIDARRRSRTTRGRVGGLHARWSERRPDSMRSSGRAASSSSAPARSC